MKEPLKPKRAPRPTVADVARQAAVSVATVDRVLNRRAPVKAATARRVQLAAEALGFHAAGLLGRRVADLRPERTLGFLLQRRTDPFYRLFASELAAASRDATAGPARASVEHMDDLTPGRVAEHLLRLGAKVEAIGVVAADHPKVAAAVERLRDDGVPVFALLSDLTAPARAGFFGIDHRKAGRTAAWTMARLARPPGDLCIVVGSHRYLGHELCEMSFRSYIRENAPGFRLLDAMASFEDTRFAHEATLDLLRRHPGLAGLYVAGGGIEGVIEALREHPDGARVVVVCNELMPATRAALIDGIVDLSIVTPLAALSKGLVAAMLARLEGTSEAFELAMLPFGIAIAENL